jgi:hypothetical protein
VVHTAFSYSADCGEPLHAHVERERNVAKFWLEPVRVQTSGGFKRSELNQIHRLIEDNIVKLMRGWDERCLD